MQLTSNPVFLPHARATTFRLTTGVAYVHDYISYYNKKIIYSSKKLITHFQILPPVINIYNYY